MLLLWWLYRVVFNIALVVFDDVLVVIASNVVDIIKVVVVAAIVGVEFATDIVIVIVLRKVNHKEYRSEMPSKKSYVVVVAVKYLSMLKVPITI